MIASILSAAKAPDDLLRAEDCLLFDAKLLEGMIGVDRADRGDRKGFVVLRFFSKNGRGAGVCGRV